MQHQLSSQVRGEIDRNQREFFLRQQLRAIQKELGEIDDLEAFLHSLTATRLDSEFTDGSSPTTVPSGLTPPLSELPPALTP